MFWKNEHGETPLIVALSNCHPSIATDLMERGADVQHQDNYGQYAIMYAASNNWFHVIRAMIDCHQQQHGGALQEPMALFSVCGAATCDILVEKCGADVNARCTRAQRTPLHIAAQYDCIDVAKSLIKHGADKHAVDINANTPLHYAAEYNGKDVFRYLCEQLCDVSFKNNDNESPWGIVTRNDNGTLQSLAYVYAERCNVCRYCNASPYANEVAIPVFQCCLPCFSVIFRNGVPRSWVPWLKLGGCPIPHVA